jgi:hypothetical protein
LVPILEIVRNPRVKRSSTTPLNFYELPGGFVRMTSMNKTYTPELRGYPGIVSCDFRYLKGTGFFNGSGLKRRSMR